MKSKAILIFNSLPDPYSSQGIRDDSWGPLNSIYEQFHAARYAPYTSTIGNSIYESAQNFADAIIEDWNHMGPYNITVGIRIPPFNQFGTHWVGFGNAQSGNATIIFEGSSGGPLVQNMMSFFTGGSTDEDIKYSLIASSFSAYNPSGTTKLFDMNINIQSKVKWNYDASSNEFIIKLFDVGLLASFPGGTGDLKWTNDDLEKPYVQIEATKDCITFSNIIPNNAITVIIENEVCVPDVNFISSDLLEADSDQCNFIKLSVETSELLTEITSPSVINGNTDNPLIITVPRGQDVLLEGTDVNLKPFSQTFSIPKVLSFTNIDLNIQITNTLNQSMIKVVSDLPSLELQYKLDAGDWQTSNIFYVPLDDTYTMYVKDQYGCEISETFIVDEWFENIPVTVKRRRCGGLHELNVGKYLNICGKQYTMKIGFVCNNEPNHVKIFKHIQMILNTTYSIKSVTVKTSQDQERLVPGTHMVYRIREGMHSVPLKNPRDFDDLRGSWAYIEIEIESINNKKVDLFSVITHLRKSSI